MSERLYIYLPVEGYLREWLLFTLGDPVVFPARSNENAIIARYLQPLPPDTEPQLPTEGTVAITAPEIHGKPSNIYNYFGRRGQVALLQKIEMLFCMDLWQTLVFQWPNKHVNAAVDLFCEQHGISLDNREAVRQKYYRIRKDYRQRGIILGAKYKMKTVVEKGKWVQQDLFK